MQNEYLLDQLIPLLAEVLRRKNHPSQTYVPDDSPDRNQLAFHKSNTLYNLLFGGNQSGKSRACFQELWWWGRGEHPYKEVPKAAKIWVISALYQNLDSGVYKHFREYAPDWDVLEQGPNIDDWDIPKWTRIRGGGYIKWMSSEGGGAQARKKFQSEDLDAVFIDEEVKEDVKIEVLMRLLARGGKMFISATLVDSEPWITELEELGESGDPDVSLVRLSSKAAARAGHIDLTTLRSIIKGLSREDIEVRVEGRSRKSQGLVYPNFRPKAQVVPPRPIEGECTRYCAIDPGWDVCAVLWAAVFPGGEVNFYRELYLHNADTRRVAFEILAAEGWSYDEDNARFTPSTGSEVIEARVIDPSAFGHNTDGSLRIGHRLPTHGVKMLRPAVNDLDVGIDAVRCLMEEFDADGRPKLTVQRHLSEWLKERASYRFPRRKIAGDRSEPKAKPVKRRDHLMDATRYLATIPGGLVHKRKPDSRALLAVEVETVFPYAATSLQVAHQAELRRLKQDKPLRREPAYNLGGYGSDY